MARAWRRWLIAALAGVTAFSAVWWFAERVIGLDSGSATAWAGLVAGIIMTPLGVWATLGTDVSRPPHDDGLGPQPSTRRRILVLAAVTTGLLGISLGTYLTTRGYVPTNGTPTNTPSLPGTDQTWAAKVDNTMATRAGTLVDVGTFTYHGPFGTEQDRVMVRSVWRGYTLSVVCQEHHGRLVQDPSTGGSSAIWNRLYDGSYISDLYTDLPKSDADRASLGIPTCVYPGTTSVSLSG